MKPKTAAILSHIIDSLLLIIISVPLVLLIWVFSHSYFENLIFWFSKYGIFSMIFILLMFPCIIAWQFPKVTMSVCRSMLLFPRHLGFAYRIFFCSILTIGIAWKFHLIKEEDAWVILIYEITIVFLCFMIAKFHLYLQNKIKFVVIDSEKDDRPIQRLDENLFPEFENIAHKILKQLQLSTSDDNHGPNVALIGPYGSGKTSMCNLIKCVYNNPTNDHVAKEQPNSQKKIKIIFCRFEAWQYLTADAAIRGLLDEIVSKVEEYVDSVSLTKIPTQYLEALGSCPYWLARMFSILLGKRPSSKEVVGILQNILLRINRKVVVFVDDLDRLETHSVEAQDAVAAALNQLQNLTSVQYVLCVGPSMMMEKEKPTPKVNYDLLKSTRFQEIIPDMPSESVLERLRDLRDEAISSDEKMYYVWNEKESDDPFRYNPMLEHFEHNIASQAIKLIQKPRQLKTVERETREKWNSLKGEISWYDLLMINIIKSCELPVFEWIINEKNQFLDGPFLLKDAKDEDKQEFRDSIDTTLINRISVRTESQFKLVRQVLLDLFPNFMKGLGGWTDDMTRSEPQAWEQRLSFNPLYGISYFERFKSGHISKSEISDQYILQYIRKISLDGFERSEFEEKFLSSFQKLTNNINRFKQFSGLLTKDLAIEVSDCILDWMCNREHWSVWDPIDQYPSSVMSDVKTIIEDAGQFYSNRSWRRQTQPPGTTRNLEKWIAEKLEVLLGEDVIVAYDFIHFVAKYQLNDNTIREMVGNKTKSLFFNEHGSLWEKIKDSYNHLRSILEMLRYNDDYEEMRDEVTKLVVEKVERDKDEVIVSNVLMSLAHFTYPAPDLIDQYKFSVNKSENNQVYNMTILLPLINNLKNHEFTSPVVSKAFKHLLQEYSSELNEI